MSVVAFILWLAAVVLFLVAAYVPLLFGRLIGIGLALTTAGLIVQFGVTSHWNFV